MLRVGRIEHVSCDSTRSSLQNKLALDELDRRLRVPSACVITEAHRQIRALRQLGDAIEQGTVCKPGYLSEELISLVEQDDALGAHKPRRVEVRLEEGQALVQRTAPRRAW